MTKRQLRHTQIVIFLAELLNGLNKYSLPINPRGIHFFFDRSIRSVFWGGGAFKLEVSI